MIAVTFLGTGRGSSRLHLAPVVTEGSDGLLVAVAAAGTGVCHLAGRDARHTLRLFALVIMPQSCNFHRLAACFRITYRAVSNFFIRARRSAGRGDFVLLLRLARRMPEGCHFHRLAAHFLSAAQTGDDFLVRACRRASGRLFILSDGSALGMPQSFERFRLLFPAGTSAFAQALLGAGGLIDDYPRGIGVGVFRGGVATDRLCRQRTQPDRGRLLPSQAIQYRVFS